MSFCKFSLIQKNNLTTESQSAYWRFRVMFFMMVGYAAFYFVRQNLSFAMPGIGASLGFSKSDLGKITSTFGIIYGFGKVISGIFSDRSSARVFLATGLMLSAIANIFMGASSSLWLMISIWLMNSCFQAMGAPACAKLLAHWYSPKEIGTRWAVWSSSQHIGSAIIGICIVLFLPTLGWRYAFYIPGVLCAIVSLFVFFGIRDEPNSVGLNVKDEASGANIDNTKEDECAHMTSFEILIKRVLRNKMVWAMGAANFFLYFVRMSVFFWAPMFLCEAKGNSVGSAGLETAAFNIAGILGSIASGMLSDKLFKGYRGRAGFFFMIGLSISIFMLWFAPNGMPIIHTLVMLSIGFFVAGPQTMVGVAAVDFASKRAAGSASGLTGTCGYIGAATSGVGTAYIAEHSFGWHGVFAMMLLSAFIGSLCFIFTWNARSKAFEKKIAKSKKNENISEKAA